MSTVHNFILLLMGIFQILLIHFNVCNYISVLNQTVTYIQNGSLLYYKKLLLMKLDLHKKYCYTVIEEQELEGKEPSQNFPQRLHSFDDHLKQKLQLKHSNL